MKLKSKIKNEIFFDQLHISLWTTSSIILTLSLYHQYIDHTEPCTLCLWQRNIFFIIFSISPLGFIRKFNNSIRSLLSLLFISSFLLGTYHILVQYGWLNDRCSVQNIGSINDFIPFLEKPKNPCSRIGWKIFGLSVSMYNALISLIAIFAINFKNLLILGSRCLHMLEKTPQKKT